MACVGVEVGLDDIRGTGKELRASLDSAANITRTAKSIIDYDGISSNSGRDFLKYREPDLPKRMLKLLEDPEGADVKFIVWNETIKAHKIVLVARSAYFRRMFQCLPESGSKQIYVDGIDPSLFKEVLKFVYSGSAPKEISSIAMELLPLADRYELEELKLMCESVIDSHLTVDNVIQVLLLADRHNCPKLTKLCIPLFKANISYLKGKESWGKLKENFDLIVSLLENCF